MNWSDAQLQCPTNVAHGLGRRVCAHVTYPRDYAQAIRCGVNSVRHTSWESMRDEDLDQMAERGIVFVPTLSLIELMVKGAAERWFDDPKFNPPINGKIRDSLLRFTEAFHRTSDEANIEGTCVAIPKGILVRAADRALENFKRFVRRGGAVAIGTDASLGFLFHTSPRRELKLMAACGLFQWK